MRGVVAVVMLCAAQLLCAQIRIIPQERLLEAANPKTATTPLRFVADKVSFGTIDEMSGVWQGSATLINSGTDTIAITRVKSTCGCLKAELAKGLLAPKATMKVALTYYPRGHAGAVMQRLFVYSNKSEEHPSAILEVRGVVTASADRSDDYPYARGVLRLRQDTVRMSGEREVLRVAFMNGGSVELNLSVDTNFLPEGVRVRFEPSKVAPKGEGEMVVEYEPSAVKSPINVGKIYIKGLNLPPRQSVIDVVLKK